MNSNTAAAFADTPALSIDAMRQILSQPELAEHQLHALLATLASQDEERVAWANDCLQQIEQPAENVELELSRLCSAECVPVASWACKLLGRLSNQSRETEEAIVGALRDHPSIAVKQSAASALGKIQELSNLAKDVLGAASQADDARLRRLATQSLASANR